MVMWFSSFTTPCDETKFGYIFHALLSLECCCEDIDRARKNNDVQLECAKKKKPRFAG